MTKRDKADIEKLASVLRRESKRGSCFPRVLDLIACGSGDLSYRRVCSLLLRFEKELADAAGLVSVKYSKAEYRPSDAGAFGRYGGGKRGKYHPPRVYIETLIGE